MTRSLFSKRPSPYYLLAPDFRRNSAGIRVMHMLCDALMRSGYEAYVTANVLSPGLMTPRLTNDVIKTHQTQGVEPIVVYPEVVSGNPLAGNVVARYLLNRPGFLSRGVTAESFGKDDLIFAYTKDLQLPDRPADRVMFMPPFDRSIFCLPQDPAKRVPGKVCYYRGRSAQSHIDPAILGDNPIEITPHFPNTWEGLADVFQQCEYFYCAESSALAGEAALCGCISVLLSSEWAPQVIGKSETQGFGLAHGNDPAQIEEARRTLPLLLERIVQQEQEFWPALDNFIDITQAATREYQEARKGGAGTLWLAPRVLTNVERGIAKAYLRDKMIPALELVVFDFLGQPDKLNRTLNSINALDGLYASIQICVMGVDVSKVAPQVNLDTVKIPAVDYMECINHRLFDSGAEWFMCLNAGDELTSSGFLVTALDLSGSPDWRAVYADEVLRYSDGHLELMLRPDFNLDLLLSTPATLAKHWLFRRDVWQAMGGFITDCPDAFELEYILRLVENTGLDSLRHVSEPLVISDMPFLHDSEQERAVIEHHLRVRGFESAQVNCRVEGQYELDYVHSGSPLVSILILIDGQLTHAQRCIESLLEQTTYSAYELLLLDRGNDDPSVYDWLSGIEQLGAAHIRVLRYPAAPTVQAIRNDAVSDAQGEFLLFLDSTIGIMGQYWLQQLLNQGVRQEVGCVGAKLVGGDGKVRHAGLLAGLGGTVGKAFEGMPSDSPGYMQRLQVDQNYSALSDQCLMLRRELFLTVGGFDEKLAPWADADLCLKVQQAGYLNVWTPRVQLLAGDVESPIATAEQEDRLYERWLPQLAHDRAYNPNFSLARGQAFIVEDSLKSWHPLSSHKLLPRVLAHPAEQTGNAQRIIAPFTVLRAEGLIEGLVSPELLSVVDLQRYDPDVIVLQQVASDVHLQAMRRMKAFSRAFKVFEPGEYLPITEGSLAMLHRGLSSMDRLVVSSNVMAQAFEGFCPDIRVVESRLNPIEWEGLVSERRCSDKPRVGWAGGLADVDELEMIGNVIKDLAGDVHWVVLGPCPEALRPFVQEVHNTVNIAAYPAKLASLNLDLALAPLGDTMLNRCKSHLRLLEYGVCGFPVICSDLQPYRSELSVTRVQNSYEAWVETIRAHVSDLEAAAQLGNTLRDQVRCDWMLAGQSLVTWRNIWLPN